jgi:SAM-dependent methyltransferase
MLPKPKGWAREYAVYFQDDDVAGAYPYRPPYPAETFDILSSLIVDGPRTVLDVGCGTGDIARPLARIADRVDAVDFSAAMIERGRSLPGGDAPTLRWVLSSVEEAPLDGPYALTTAGESLHWLAWDVVMPRFTSVLTPHGSLALIERDWDHPPAILERLRPIFRRYAVNRDYQPLDLVTELERRGLFERKGEVSTGVVPWTPTVEEYLECRHSQNGLPRGRMGEEAALFDRAVREALDGLQRDGVIKVLDGRLQLGVSARVVWGKPRSGWEGLRSSGDCPSARP